MKSNSLETASFFFFFFRKCAQKPEMTKRTKCVAWKYDRAVLFLVNIVIILGLETILTLKYIYYKPHL